MHYIILGNGGAGISALQSIRTVDTTSDITIISREQFPPYSPCSLPNLIAGEIDKSAIFRFDTQFYDRLNATFIKNTEALGIDAQNNKIILSNKKHLKFDKLLIAIGATPITPRGIKGIDLDGVHIMGTLDSTLGILDHLKKGICHAIVIGGGFMGVETATMLRKRGLNVSIVEMLPHILSRMLDPDIADKVAKILTNHGIQLILNDTVKSINGSKKVTNISLEKQRLSADMVVSAIGVRPNIEILNKTGIQTHHGVIVDSHMQTTIKNIYAAGDIAEVHEQITGKKGSYGIWPNAIEQGRIAGLNMANTQTTYNGAEVVNVLDVFDIPVIAMGHIIKDAGKCTILSRFTPASSKKMLLNKNRIIGLQFIGTIRNTGAFYGMMKKGIDIESIANRLLDDNFVIIPETLAI
ncbi:MAG: FAD-dependent oxidoreductase [Candidatus Thermoplasmatota archaeon]|nr:FAD-dependent oxidoreductase [Candidatus Thermoplasmatota archaeon]MBU1940435.1 FAD-dependent oxidoreductase [Candidatus Thermoplasmatota archaeon]